MPMKYPAHPGRIIRSNMEALGLSNEDAAQKLGVSAEQLTAVINGHGSVSPAMAVELSKVFGGDDSTWTLLQTRYDEAKERNKGEVAEELEPLPN